MEVMSALCDKAVREAATNEDLELPPVDGIVDGSGIDTPEELAFVHWYSGRQQTEEEEADPRQTLLRSSPLGLWAGWVANGRVACRGRGKLDLLLQAGDPDDVVVVLRHLALEAQNQVEERKSRGPSAR